MCDYFRYESTDSKPLTQTEHMQVFKCSKPAITSINSLGLTEKYCLFHAYKMIEVLENLGAHYSFGKQQNVD